MYVWKGLEAVAVLPSPKFQRNLRGSPLGSEERLAKEYLVEVVVEETLVKVKLETGDRFVLITIIEDEVAKLLKMSVALAVRT